MSRVGVRERAEPDDATLDEQLGCTPVPRCARAGVPAEFVVRTSRHGLERAAATGDARLELRAQAVAVDVRTTAQSIEREARIHTEQTLEERNADLEVQVAGQHVRTPTQVRVILVLSV